MQVARTLTLKTDTRIERLQGRGRFKGRHYPLSLLTEPTTAHKFNSMSRFVADVWGLVAFGLDQRNFEVLSVATKSQDLFRKAGINTAATGKMSTKQAINKIDALVTEHSVDFGKDGVSTAVQAIVAYKQDTDTLMVYGNSEDCVNGKMFEELKKYSPSSDRKFGMWWFNMSQLQQAVGFMLDHVAQPEFTESKTTKIETMGQTPQELMLQAMSMLQQGGSIDEAAVERIVDKRLKEQRAVKVEVVSAKATKRIDKAHKNFADAVALVGLGKNIAMIGEAGSGKSYGAIQMAQALDLDYSVVSCHGKMQSFDLVGAMSPTTGQYISTALRDAYENGKVLILDEFDRSNTETTIALNGILAGDCYGFPDGMVKRNPAFRVIACQNTFGSGSSKTYASAKAQDGSTLTRFTRIEWDIDTKLETAICGNNNVTRAVQSIRQNAKDKGYDQILITPRQAIDANQMVDSLGWTAKKAIEFTCLNGLAGDVKKRLMDGVSL